MSLTDLRFGFRDAEQLAHVRRHIHCRLADDRRQQECRYLMRFWWQLGMPYTEVTLEQLRTHVSERKMEAIDMLIAAIRTSHEEIDAWADAVQREFPVIFDRGSGEARGQVD